MMKTASFSSRREDSGWSNGLAMTAEVSSYEVRQMSFTPQRWWGA